MSHRTLMLCAPHFYPTAITILFWLAMLALAHPSASVSCSIKSLLECVKWAEPPSMLITCFWMNTFTVITKGAVGKVNSSFVTFCLPILIYIVSHGRFSLCLNVLLLVHLQTEWLLSSSALENSVPGL